MAESRRFRCLRADLAKSWAQTEELEGEDLLPLLRDLRRLAKSAIGKKQGIYLWGYVDSSDED